MNLRNRIFTLAKAILKPDDRYFGGALNLSDMYRQNFSHGLTPVGLKAIFEQADMGDIFAQMQLFDEMEEKDLHLYSELQKRKMAVTRWPWRIAPRDEKDARSVEIAARVEEMVRSIPDFEDDLLDIMDALGKGMSFTELIWDNSEGATFIKDLEWIAPYHFMPYNENIPFTSFPDGKAWKIRTKEHMTDGEALPENKFIVHKMRAKSGSPVRAGLVRICAWMYIFKNYAIKDWSIFLDLYGIPLRIGKYGTGAGDAEKNILKAAVVGLGTDGAGIISKETEIEIIEATKSTGTNVHEMMAAFCNREMSKGILGTVNSGDRGTGTYAEETANIEVRADLTAADIRSVCSTLRRDLVRPLTLFNFGEEDVRKNLPSFEIVISEPVDLRAEAETDRIVIRDIGLPASKGWLREKYGIPEPADEKDTLEVPTAPAMFSKPADESIVLKKNSRSPSDARKTLRMRPRSGK